MSDQQNRRCPIGLGNCAPMPAHRGCTVLRGRVIDQFFLLVLFLLSVRERFVVWPTMPEVRPPFRGASPAPSKLPSRRFTSWSVVGAPRAGLPAWEEFK